MAKTSDSGKQLAAGSDSSDGSEAPSFRSRLRNSQSLQDIFELVREAVWKALRIDQAGLMLGLAELGIGSQRVLGAFYSPDANTIVMNKTVMSHVKRLADQLLYNSYCFYILLHEYLHSCGFYGEHENRRIVAAMAAECFGPGHAVTKLATTHDGMLKLIQETMRSSEAGIGGAGGSESHNTGPIEFVEGIDRRNTNYIM